MEEVQGQEQQMQQQQQDLELSKQASKFAELSGQEEQQGSAPPTPQEITTPQ